MSDALALPAPSKVVAVDVAAHKRPLALALARRYARRALRLRFDGVFVDGLDEIRALCAARPVIFAANHVCWWDAFAMVVVDEALGTDGRVLMDERNLRRLPFFRPLGALPLDIDGGPRTRRQLEDAARVLDRPGRALWLFPQGRQRATHLRPLAFKPGLRLLAGRAVGDVAIVPTALAWPWREAPAPSAVVRFGAAVEPTALPRAELVRSVEERVAALLSEIDADIDAGREPGRLLLPGAVRGAEDGLGARLLRRWSGGA